MKERPGEGAVSSSARHLSPAKVHGAGQDHEKQLAEYADIRQEVLAFRDYIIAYHPEEGKLIDQLETCGSWLFFRWFYRVDIHRLAGGFTCKKHLFCTCCAVRRAAVYAKSYEQAVRYVLSENLHLVPILITYTVKNGPDLAERFAHLKKVQRSLLLARRRFFDKGRRPELNPTILRHVQGGAGSYEVKIGSGSGEWHIHIHEIALLDSREFTFTEQLLPIRKKHPDDVQRYKRVYVPEEFKSALRAEWKKITGDSDQVDVRGLYPRDQYSRLHALPEQDSLFALVLPDQEGPDAPDSIFSGVCEAFKYALKTDGGMTHEQHFHAAKILSGSRLIYSYGSLRNVQVPDESADIIEESLKDEPYLEKVYRYHHGSYVLDRINEGDEIVFPIGSVPRFKQSKPPALNRDSFPTKSFFTAWMEEYKRQQQEGGEEPF